jgi:hypothetical protein
MTVENNLKKITGISEVTADQVTGKVIIKGENINLTEAEKTIENLGYKYKGVI